MARYMAQVCFNQEQANTYADTLKGSVFGYLQGRERDQSGYIQATGARLKIPSQRWALGSSPGDRMSFGHVWKILRAPIYNLFTQHPQGYIGFVSSGGGDIKEIIFVPSGTKHADRAPDTHAGYAQWQSVMLLAFHQSFAVARAVKKVESVVLNKGFPIAAAPLDLASWVEKQAKDVLQKPKGYGGAVGL